MNATTAIEPTANDEALVAERSNTVLFLSRRRELRLVREPRYPVLAAGSGRQAGEHPGQVVHFANGQFTCPVEGEVTLEDGRTHDAAEILEWLENHKLNGDVNGGFWRVDAEAPAVSMAEIELLVKAAQDYDAETLLRVLDQERAGWQREQIITVAEGSLARIRRMEELAADQDKLTEQAEAEREAQQARAEQLAARERELEAREQALRDAEKIAPAPDAAAVEQQREGAPEEPQSD